MVKIQNSITLLVLLSFSLLLSSQPRLQKEKERENAAIVLLQPKNDNRIMNREHQRVSSIACSEDGSVIYISWYTGGKGEQAGNFVTLSVSTDGGKSWKHDELVAYPKDPNTRFYDPVLWRDHRGQVWWFYAVSMHKQYFDPKTGVNAIAITWDGKKVQHKKPRLLSYGVMMNDPIYIPEKDMTLFASYVKINKSKENRFEVKDYVQDGTFIYAHHHKKNGQKFGKELEPYSYIPVLRDEKRIFDEHNIVQIAEGSRHFMALIRYKGGMYFSRSYDYGKTWRSLEPFTAAGPTTSSRCYLGRLQSGNLLLVMNASKSRTHMTAFISEDGGHTWPHQLLLDERKSVSYPDVDQSSDGIIHVTYDRDRSGAQEINYCRFKEEDVIKGDDSAIFRTRIN